MILFLIISLALAQVTTHEFNYGKYYSYNRGQKADINNYFCFTPTTLEEGRLYPVQIEIHGGGFTGGRATTSPNDWINALVESGFIYCSINYRLVATKYYYHDDSIDEEKVEEFLKIDSAGKISIDPERTVDDYNVRVGRTEFVTKCIYDSVQALEHLLENTMIPIDSNKIGFEVNSAGTLEAQYLTWIYPTLNSEGLPNSNRYTVKSLMGNQMQFTYPVQNMMANTIELYAIQLGEDTRISDWFGSTSSCETTLNNPWCSSRTGETNICNDEWSNGVTNNICGNSEATIRDAMLHNAWKEDPSWTDEERAHDVGLRLVHDVRLQMQQWHAPGLSVWSRNANGNDYTHHASYSLEYGRWGDAEGDYDYLVMYGDFEGLPSEDKNDLNGNLYVKTNTDFEFDGQLDGTDGKVQWLCRAFGACGTEQTAITDPPIAEPADCASILPTLAHDCTIDTNRRECRQCVRRLLWGRNSEEVNGCERNSDTLEAIRQFCP